MIFNILLVYFLAFQAENRRFVFKNIAHHFSRRNFYSTGVFVVCMQRKTANHFVSFCAFLSQNIKNAKKSKSEHVDDFCLI